MGRPVQIDSTRTSGNWASRPGNFDRLNTRALFSSSNPWDIPDLPRADYVPDMLIPYNSREAFVNPVPGSAVHFFLDDYRFETAWTRPEQMLPRVQRPGISLTPDFSLWNEMPVAMQIWQVYRNRWCCAFYAHNGVTVIPTISWAGPSSFEFAFAGVPMGSVVAVSTVGIRRRKDLYPGFYAGYNAMMNAIDPPIVLCYGKTLPEMAGTIRVYPTRWERPWVDAAAAEAVAEERVAEERPAAAQM